MKKIHNFFGTIHLAMRAILYLIGDKYDYNTDRWEGCGTYNEPCESCNEIRELVIQEGWEFIGVDARPNGDIIVEGWGEDKIQIHAEVCTKAKTLEESRDLLSNIEIRTDRKYIRANGPDMRSREIYWSIDYHLMVPEKSNLDLKTFNGEISLKNVDGHIYVKSVNGGLKLDKVGGDVKADTTNGGLKIKLHGDCWRGNRLCVDTINGNIDFSIPENYSAKLLASTLNGHIFVSFPITVHGRIGNNQIRTTLGKGGGMIDAKTLNGAVKILGYQP